MKRLLSILIFFTFLSSVALIGENKMHLQISAGLAIPNESISQFYTDTKQQVSIDSMNGWGSYILDQAATLGYAINVKGRIELSDRITLMPGIGIARFNKGKYNMEVPLEDISDTAHVVTNSIANIVPISLAISGYLFKSFISPYATAELAYNYAAYSYDVQIEWADSMAVPMGLSSTSSYLGYGIGAGIDISLGLISLNLEAKYNMLNFIKSTSAEPTKKHLTFTFGVIF